MASAIRKGDVDQTNIPDIVVDSSNGKQYLKGRFLGKGGFAKCYELTDAVTKEVFAGKIVPKSALVKQQQKDKMSQEIAIHRSLCHKHVVGFHTFFEDSDNIYILLELCRRRSLMELHKRRKAVTEPEARYFVKQIVGACQYLHNSKVIHRDLKLGNLFLNDEMEIKIGDFGLATRLDFDGERKRTLCGTPNYIAPEVLGKKGHSYEVDMWSLGCIVYTLLVGKPPFQTSSLKDTYCRIKKNEYHIPSDISTPARTLITKLLQADPGSRPTMDLIMEDEFFKSGYLPPRLPTSCLTLTPRFDTIAAKTEAMIRKPLLAVSNGGEFHPQPARVCASKRDTERKEFMAEGGDAVVHLGGVCGTGDRPSDYWLSDLFAQLSALKTSKPDERFTTQMDEAEDPACTPIYWMSKWVDYSDKYGLGYQLCDNSIGVLFNDSARLLLLANGENIHYIERNGKEHYHTLKVYPEMLAKKVTLLKYFRNYMNEHLLKAGANMTPRDSDEMMRLPFMRTWFRTSSAIVMHLSNGTLQINFFQDHTKVILCPLMAAVTYINKKQQFHTYRMNLIEQYGCSKSLSKRLSYAITMVERLLNSHSTAVKSAAE